MSRNSNENVSNASIVVNESNKNGDEKRDSDISPTRLPFIILEFSFSKCKLFTGMQMAL